MDRNAFAAAAAVGAVLQAILVLLGHFVVFIADNVFALGGAAIALLAGFLYARRAVAGARPRLGAAAAGAVSALVGVAVATALGDVPWIMLPIGALAGFLFGLAGGALAPLLPRARGHAAPAERP